MHLPYKNDVSTGAQSELSWVADAGKLIRARASTLLHKGMDTLNQAELGAALQVKYHRLPFCFLVSSYLVEFEEMNTLIHEVTQSHTRLLEVLDVSVLVQMFFDLRCLPERVEEALSRVIESVQSTAAAAFDVSTLAKTVGNPVASPGTAAASTSVRKPGNAKGPLCYELRNSIDGYLLNR